LPLFELAGTLGDGLFHRLDTARVTAPLHPCIPPVPTAAVSPPDPALETRL
jgi:hypothetical protein